MVLVLPAAADLAPWVADDVPVHGFGGRFTITRLRGVISQFVFPRPEAGISEWMVVG